MNSATFILKVCNSLKFRTRYFLFSSLGLKSTSFASLFFEAFLYRINRKIAKKHGVSLSVGIKSHKSSFIFKRKNFGIVFHGKISNLSYLQKSLKDMREACPDSPIVLATYSADLTNELLDYCNRLNIDVSSLTEPGALTPPYSVNLARAVASAEKGLIRARDNGAHWAMKIRVDQDLTRKDGLLFVEQILEGNLFSGDLKNRIIGTSYNTYRDLPIFLSDMLHFGRIEDLLKYWESFPSNEVDRITNEVFGQADKLLESWKFVPEVWLAARYLYNCNEVLSDSEALNWIFWSKYAGVIDSVTVGQNWAKTFDFFDSNYASIKWLEESFSAQYLELHFSDWLQIVLQSRNETVEKDNS